MVFSPGLLQYGDLIPCWAIDVALPKHALLLQTSQLPLVWWPLDVPRGGFPGPSWSSSLMYSIPQLHGILYTTPALLSIGSGSFTLESCHWRVEMVVNMKGVHWKDWKDGKNFVRHNFFFASESWFSKICVRKNFHFAHEKCIHTSCSKKVDSASVLP